MWLINSSGFTCKRLRNKSRKKNKKNLTKSFFMKSMEALAETSSVRPLTSREKSKIWILNRLKTKLQELLLLLVVVFRAKRQIM